MSYGPLVEIPSGYCFIPSCDPKPTSSSYSSSSSSSSSSSRSLTTSTTTVYGPTFTAAASPTLTKRSATVHSVVAMLGTHSLQTFPTDLPVQVGSGPVCIVFCEWARLQNEDLERHPMRPLRPIMSEGMMTTSTMMSVHKSTITGEMASMSMTTQSMPLAISSAATHSPSPSTQQQHKLHAHPTTHIVAFVFSGLLGLALLLAIAWLVTRQIRKIKARLNPHTMGVHRDRARELYEQDGGKGVPEMGARGV
ncbi:MAG: hypothetical protein Q9177_004497 [Variospora cf. flavescens]